ncbi:MAG: hypothetical protein LBF22_12650 [Deltaproteobacteria bacterium]|nr:hypothetical protein [Deltaproteobacteria bacterium]
MDSPNLSHNPETLSEVAIGSGSSPTISANSEEYDSLCLFKRSFKAILGAYHLL